LISGEKICFVAVPVAEFGPLSPIPARYPAEILGDPGQPVDLVRPAIQASLQETPEVASQRVQKVNSGEKMTWLFVVSRNTRVRNPARADACGSAAPSSTWVTAPAGKKG